MRETWVRPLGWEDPQEKEMATHSSTLAWRIPWTEEPGGLQSTGSQSRTRLSQSLVVVVVVLLLRFGAKFCLGRAVFSLGWECLNRGVCTGEQHKPGAPHNVRASSVQHLASNVAGSPGTTLMVRGSLAFGIGSSEQCVDWPGLQAANEGARHLAQGKRRPLPAAYLVLSRTCCPKARPPGIVCSLRDTHVQLLLVFSAI